MRDRGTARYAARQASRGGRATATAGQPPAVRWTSDPGLRVQVEAILALLPEDRLRMLEIEVGVLSDLRPAAG
ncbi:hypothetical protein FRAHR75_690011 [Frankia sp. Hr75.2]|nr:hypothetical protein FRAHR75_690011 [Frankia sp. Hr75.2]